MQCDILPQTYVHIICVQSKNHLYVNIAGFLKTALTCLFVMLFEIFQSILFACFKLQCYVKDYLVDL